MAPVAQNFERHSLVSSIQKQNQRESTASRNFKICRTASERILNSMLTVRKFCSVFWSYVDLFFFTEIMNDEDEEQLEQPPQPESSNTDKVDDANPGLNTASKSPIKEKVSSDNEV